MSVIKKHICAMSAYLPPLDGRDPDRFKLLDFNERTEPISEKVEAALIDYIKSGRLQMYPAYGDIVKKVAAYAGVDSSRLMITNGSDQGIELVFRSVCSSGDTVIIPGPSFAMYNQCAKIEGCKILSPQYTRSHGYPVEEVMASITPDVRLIVISNPNNPCGTAVSLSQIERVLVAASSGGCNAAVLVDECYFEYANVTAVELIDRFDNLIITRTFSKTWGIPSLRFGYVISAPSNIKALLNVRGPYDINQLAVVAVRAALDDQDNIKGYVDEVMLRAKPLFEDAMSRLGIEYWRSAANYLWVFPGEPELLEECLRAAGILVRPKCDGDGRLGLRVTIGSVEQTVSAITVFEKFISTKKPG